MKSPRSKGENHQQTQPTYDAGSGNRTQDKLVRGERSHHCATPAPVYQHDTTGFSSDARDYLSSKLGKNGGNAATSASSYHGQDNEDDDDLNYDDDDHDDNGDDHGHDVTMTAVFLKRLAESVQCRSFS